MNKIKYIAIIATTFLFMLAMPVFANNYPQPTGFVVDEANVIPDDFQKTLEDRLSQYEKDTGNEVAVVMVKSLGDESVEEYAENLFERWKIGKEKQDNGVLFLSAIDDRKMRIEVGYGNEEKLTDIEAGRIIEQVKPYYKESKYAEGAGAAVNGIVEQLSGGQILDGVATASAEPASVDDGAILLFLLLLFIGVPVFLALLAFSPFTEFGGSGGWGIGSTGGSSDSGGFGGFGGGSSGGGGASGGW